MADRLITSHVRERSDFAELDLAGELSARTAPVVRTRLGKLLLDRGRVLVGISQVRATWPEAVLVFPAVLAGAGGWPAARLVLVTDEDRAHRPPWSDIARSVPIASNWTDAPALLDLRPRRISRSHDLPFSVYAAALSRALVRAACEEWELADLRNRAVLTCSELVSNAVEHARTGCVLSLTLDPLGLHVSVRDHRPGAVSIHAEAGPYTSYGLVLVRQLSRSFGVTQHPDGKTVWAVLPVTGLP